MGRIGRALLVGYVAALVASHVTWRLRSGEPAPLEDERQTVAEVPAFAAGEEVGTTRLAWLDLGPGEGETPPVLLLHGSPGTGVQLRGLAARLFEDGRRVLVPDLPGFGASRPWSGDVSIASHARELRAWLAQLEVPSVHVVGFSMGGGVALELAELDSDRVRSLTLLAATGVQELELFGRHDMNHAVHALQLGLFHAARWLLPHFGGAHGDPFSLGYARNFYDSDQRPLRGILERLAAPTLVLHGQRDFLVPVGAAQEHARIVPQAELVVFDDQNHFLPWTATERVAEACDAFFDRVEDGSAVERDAAEPDRVERAAAPFDPRDVPPLAGIALVVVVLLLAGSTFVSEDLTCLGAGLLVSQGRIGFLVATFGCFLGIFLGDMGLYLLGRWLGPPALRRAPLRWFVGEDGVQRAREWFEQKGPAVIFLSRFAPGLRLPTYVAAGVVGTRLFVFAFWFVLAGLCWTPAIVGLAAWLGESAQQYLERLGPWTLPVLIAFLALLRIAQRALTWRGRRRILGSARRWTRWEFWPAWFFYVPIVGWLAWLSLRHRGFGKVAAANPAIPGGGFVGESKADILERLGNGDGRVPHWTRVPLELAPDERCAHAREFRERNRLSLPVVLKPDVGQRGSGVLVLRDEEALDSALREQTVDCVLQQHVPGVELGVFWARRPEEARGRLISITEKRMPEVVGDGRRTLEHLILADARAVVLADAYCKANRERLEAVPAEGERVRLVELGTHARGAIFLDGERFATPALAEAIEEVSGRFEGFYFGRYDVRGASYEAIAAGDFQVIELNGVTSESTHVYDPCHSLGYAYATLFRQWSLAFDIARVNLRAGRGEPTSLPRIVRDFLAYRRVQRGHASGTVGRDGVDQETNGTSHSMG